MLARIGIGVRGLSTQGLSAIEQSRVKPMDFVGVNLKFGWVLIPKTHFTYPWTKKELNDTLDKEYGTVDPDSIDKKALQITVDKWVNSVDLTQKPKNQKLTRADIANMKEDALYRMQLREEKTKKPPGGKKSTRKQSTEGSGKSPLSFIHAWNYFHSISHHKFAHLGRGEARKEIASIWNSMSTSEKDSYRTEYAKLIEQGKDIFKGKIVNREDKLKILEKQKASKKK